MQNMIKEALNPSLFPVKQFVKQDFSGCPCDDKGTYEGRNLDARISWDYNENLYCFYFIMDICSVTG